MAEPKYHHYISQCYLNNFAIDPEAKQKKINRIDIVRKRIITNILIKNVGGQNKYNWSFSQTDPNNIEKLYATEIETPAGAALLRTITNKAFVNSTDLENILRFFAMIAARNPKKRAAIEDPMKKLDEILIRSALEKADAEKVLSARISRNLLPQEHVSMEIDLIDPFFQSLNDKTWAIIEATDETGDFITSDNPLQIMHANEPCPWGFNSKAAILYAPLSPKIAMLGIKGNLMKLLTVLNISQVAEINAKILTNAHEEIFYKSEHFYIQRYSTHEIVSWKDIRDTYK